MSIDRHRVDTSTHASGELDMNYSIAAESTLAKDELWPLTKQNYGSIIVGTGQAGPPLAKRLCESVSELIPTMLEEQTVLKLIRWWCAIRPGSLEAYRAQLSESGRFGRLSREQHHGLSI
jgi:hypothetical protein